MASSIKQTNSDRTRILEGPPADWTLSVKSAKSGVPGPTSKDLRPPPSVLVPLTIEVLRGKSMLILDQGFQIDL
jgi:hypothetical protein